MHAVTSPSLPDHALYKSARPALRPELWTPDSGRATIGRMRSRPSAQPRLLSLLVALLLLLVSCRPQEQDALRVFLDVGTEARRIVSVESPLSVRDVLQREGIVLGPNDRIDPSEFTTVSDGLVITVVRVSVANPCEDQEIPFDREILPNEAMAPGEEHLAQTGRNGLLRICYRVETVNGVESDRVPISRVVIQEPVNEIVFQGVAPPPPVRFEGTLAYISNGNAWIMRGNSATKRPLTTEGGLDGRVFELSPDGRRLVFTRAVEGSAEYFNSLWVIMNTRQREAEAIELLPDNVLYAEWVPGVESTLAYSTSDARPSPPGWQARNDLWLLTLHPETAETLQVLNLVEESSGGLMGWWGTTFRWSPDGLSLAWARADSVGIVDMRTRTLLPLFEFPAYNTYGDWAWVPTLSWSPQSDFVLTTVHGAPLGAEAPEDSPVFDIAITSPDGTLQIKDFIPQAGIWASPQFSPLIDDGTGGLNGHIAYLRIRGGASSLALGDRQYELVVADLDGSNPRVVFPSDPQAPGLAPQQDIAWSPDAQHIAFIFQGDLWIVDITSGVTSRLTADRSASKPRWAE